MSVVNLCGIKKSYYLEQEEFPVLREVNLTLSEGDCVAIVGASGSGKSTLMNIVGLLDRPDEGQYFLNDKLITRYSDDELAALRNKEIGFVFQSFFLLPRMTVLQNVGLPLLYRNENPDVIKEKALEVLERVGLKDYAQRKSNQLSGGQQQRVAIARALIAKPALLLADEPTGALDKRTSEEIVELFLELNQEEKMTILIITHEEKVASRCKNSLRMEEGSLL